MATPEAPARRVGGRYRLDRSIGSGGMGTVWEGTDELLDRRVAIKAVRFPDLVGDAEAAELKERTLREARATARLTHPNVVTTYDVVEDGGRPYIVMELLDARSLSEVLREDGPLPPRRVAQVGLDLLSALEASHAQGVVHRDVKPGNVLLTPDGRAVLTDFGIAMTAGDPAMTSTGVILGSPAYMPPERARGQKPGPEGDLWSLGATLYAAAEGRPPFDAADPLSTLTAVISTPVPPPQVTGPLREAILGLLTKDPAERLGTRAARQLLDQAANHPAPSPSVAAMPVAPVALDRGGRTQAFAAAENGPARLPNDDDAALWAAEEPGQDHPRFRRRDLLVAAGLLGLILVWSVMALTLLDTSPGSGDTDPSGTKQDSRSAGRSSAPAPGEGDQGIPAGFEAYTDPSGFRVAVPAGWVREQNGTAVDFEDPDSVAFLRIDRTSTPKDDPVADWEAQEGALQSRYPSYRRIGIEAVDYRGWDAADWEFTLGPNAHVLNRGFVTDPSHGYALYLSSAEADWKANQKAFRIAARTFQPAG